MQESTPPLWHVVLISFRPETSEQERAKMYNQFQSLALDCGGKKAGVLFFTVARNLDLRKNVHLVEVAVFRDSDALQAFRTHPKHKELTDILSKIADWQVGDFHRPFSFD